MENILETKVGELVANNFKIAKVLEKYNIDFCCGGDKSIRQICDEMNLNSKQLVIEIQEYSLKQDVNVIDFSSWSIDLILDYIVKKHHKEVRENIPVIRQYLNKVAEVHGDNHPEILEIKQLFDESAHDLEMHMQKEELILFPYIKKMIEADQKQESLPNAVFGTVENPIKMMSLEHDQEGDRFKKIRKLTNNYTLASEACNTYRLLYEKLELFERNLHEHIHLENNVIFPAAIKLEDKLI